MESEIFIAVLMCLLAGVFQGMVGFGYAMVTTPVLMSFVPLEQLVLLNLTNSLSLGLVALCGPNIREHVQKRDLSLLFIGALVGIPLGFWFLGVVDVKTLKICVLVVIVLAAFMQALPNLSMPAWLAHPACASITGLVSGVLTPTTGINGPPVVLYLNARLNDKNEFRSTSLAYMCLAMVTGVTGFLITGEISRDDVLRVVSAIPITICGYFIGLFLFKRVEVKTFKLVVITALILASLVGLIKLI